MAIWQYINKYELNIALVILICTLIMIFIGLSALRKAEKRRIKVMRKMDVTEPVVTQFPDEDVENITRQRAVESVQDRFAFIRR